MAFCICLHNVQAKNYPAGKSQKLYFIENKGQVTDQFRNARNDIGFLVKGEGINIFIGDGKIHYEFTHAVCNSALRNRSRCMPWGGIDQTSNVNSKRPEQHEVETYRMDVELTGANKNAEIITEQPQAYFETYYLAGGNPNGIHAATYTRLIYKNILPSIDWVFYIKDGALEHEFVVRPGGDASSIKLTYSGQTSLEKKADGSLLATTPMGVLKEHAPVCYLANNLKMPVSYQLHGNVLRYNIQSGEHTFVIDPALEWGTYYGPDTSSTTFSAVTTDGIGSVYATGVTYAGSTGNIATTGSYQYTYGGGEDAILVKFDTSGNRLWATYYGGDGLDWGYTVTCDHSGNIYMGGITTSADSIATAGSHQTSIGGVGAMDGFLAKFTSSGSLLWATYYGGDQQDEILSARCDFFNNIYIAGSASSTFNISTPGSFEPVFVNPGGQHNAGFLAKFDSTGARIWGTYYKGFVGLTSTDVSGVRGCTDGFNVYIAGFTAATDSIVTPGCWQPVFGGNTDDFIAMFDSGGNRIWATYYGGANEELLGSIISTDNELYVLGATMSDSAIASPGCAQPHRAGGVDAFLAKFNPSTGMRLWGTYYGGPDDETVYGSPICFAGANVCIAGTTASTSGIASYGAWQTTQGGGTNDAFLAEYNSLGVQQWSTYYGGSGDEEAFSCAFDGENIYVCGQTNSPDNIATTGGFKNTFTGVSGSYLNGFLGKFGDIFPGPILGPDSVCIGDTVMLSDSASGGSWASSNSAVAMVNSASGAVTGVSSGVCAITYTSSTGDFVTMSDTVKNCADKIVSVSLDKSQPKLFPNPAAAQLSITSVDKIIEITILDLLGQAVYDHIFNSHFVPIDVSALPDGVYYVRIVQVAVQPSNRYFVSTQKFLKEK